MRACARVIAEADGRGGARLLTLRSEAPLVLRETADALYLVGGAGGPLGGDDLNLHVEIGPGARLTIRTAAASLAFPGPAPSRLHVRAVVAAGGALRWLPEPVVAVRGCIHHMDAAIVMEPGATLTWREEIVLGRHHEPPGSIRTRTRVEVGGAPLLRHELSLGPEFPEAGGPAVTAGARAVGSLLLLGDDAASVRSVAAPTAAVLRLRGGGVQVVVLADDSSTLRRQLAAATTEDATLRVCPDGGAGTNRTC